jgi:hypothetical protein
MPNGLEGSRRCKEVYQNVSTAGAKRDRRKYARRVKQERTRMLPNCNSNGRRDGVFPEVIVIF